MTRISHTVHRTSQPTLEQPVHTVTTNGQVRRRRRRDEREQNPFYIPKEEIPPGISEEWKRLTYLNLTDSEHQRDLRRDGCWTPVPSRRHPSLALPDAKEEDPIIVRGQILMERPLEFTKEAQLEDLQIAIGQVRDKRRSLGLEGNELGPGTRFVNKTTYEPDAPAQDVPAA